MGRRSHPRCKPRDPPRPLRLGLRFDLAASDGRQDRPPHGNLHRHRRDSGSADHRRRLLRGRWCHARRRRTTRGLDVVADDVSRPANLPRQRRLCRRRGRHPRRPADRRPDPDAAQCGHAPEAGLARFPCGPASGPRRRPRFRRLADLPTIRSPLVRPNLHRKPAHRATDVLRHRDRLPHRPLGDAVRRRRTVASGRRRPFPGRLPLRLGVLHVDPGDEMDPGQTLSSRRSSDVVSFRLAERSGDLRLRIPRRAQLPRFPPRDADAAVGPSSPRYPNRPTRLHGHDRRDRIRLRHDRR